MHVREAEIARIAGAQDNVIDLDQLRRAGLMRGALQSRLERGEMQRMHQTVFLVGPAPPSFKARARGAAMAVGVHCAVSLEAAAALRQLRPEPAGAIDITVSGRNVRSREGIVVHRSTLYVAEVELIDGIPVTTVARTICDLAATLPGPDAEQLLIDARVARLVTDRELHAVIERAPHRPGSGRVRYLLADEAEEGYSRSRAERRLRKLLREAELPLGVFNEYICGLQVDCHWPRHRLALEVDGRRFHGHPRAFEEDRRRDQILVAAGWRVIRVTWRQLVHARLAVAVRIGQALVHGLAGQAPGRAA